VLPIRLTLKHRFAILAGGVSSSFNMGIQRIRPEVGYATRRTI
jgi:hypothetical protein